MPLQITGLDDAVAEHEHLLARAADLTPILEEFRAELEAMIDRAWSRRVSPGGDAWPPMVRASEADGDLRRACRVRIDGGALVIEVGAEHASWQFFGTRRTPGRNPLPLERLGGELVFMRRGEAGAWVDSMIARLAAYLAGAEERAS